MVNKHKDYCLDFNVDNELPECVCNDEQIKVPTRQEQQDLEDKYDDTDIW